MSQDTPSNSDIHESITAGALAEEPEPQDVTQMTPEEVVKSYTGLVKSTAQAIIHKLNCAIDLDDLIAWGYQGLLEAHERFDPKMGVSFSSYSFYRIRGAMYDGLRATGWAVRGTAIRVEDCLAVNGYLESNTLTDVNTPDAKTFSGSVKRVDQMVGDCVTICLLQSHHLEMVSESHEPSQADYTERHKVATAIHEAITEHLSDDEREILLAYHIEEWSMAEIADHMGYSKSWVSRINARAIDKLKRVLFERTDQLELYMIRG